MKKKKRCLQLVAHALASRKGVISWQVIQEFSNAASRKFDKPLLLADRRKYLERVLLPLCEVYPNPPVYFRALEIQERWRLS
ncbi:MAG: hypothetical protein ACREV2_05935, partial [Burkholderiales bacterium]